LPRRFAARNDMIANCGLRSGRRRLRAGAGGKTCTTDPVGPGRRPVPEEIVRNEAKLGQTGVCGQRRLPCGPGSETCETKPIWAGRRVNAQNKPNLATGEFTLNGVVRGSYGRFACDVPLKNKANFSIADCGLGIAEWKMSGGDAQPTRRQGARNEPNRAGGCRRPRAPNEPNLARAPGNGRWLAGRDARPECDCAKRTQFGAAAGVGGRPGAVRRGRLAGPRS
jgi:hypothetical protein